MLRVNFSLLLSNETKTFINILLVRVLRDLHKFLFRFVKYFLKPDLVLRLIVIPFDCKYYLSFYPTFNPQVFAVLLLALSYLALAEKECFAFGNTCRHFLLIIIIGSCFVGYVFIFLSDNGYFIALATANKRKISSLKNPKKLNWCGSMQHTPNEPSHSLIIWSWYKAGFKQATIFVTFGLALSPVLYKVSVFVLYERIHSL